ncbi:unnamed protein product [Tuber aestivum]|uniref:Uncharacterized protein n=1 Tax=Tuber aestivum TaxID=59557 RepID=A0A292Q968_9PEZI|nr:unnamed protein product [Tuber aestivum]
MPEPRELDLDHYQFAEKGFDDEYTLDPAIPLRVSVNEKEKITLGEIISAFEKTLDCYVIEYLRIAGRGQYDCISGWVEIPALLGKDSHEKGRIPDTSRYSPTHKHPNDKRPSLEGCEASVPGMEALVGRPADYRAKAIVV